MPAGLTSTLVILKVHNRKCNDPPPSLAIHQRQTYSRQQGSQWQKAKDNTFPHFKKGCIFLLRNQGQGALPTAHTGGRRQKREAAGKGT